MISRGARDPGLYPRVGVVSRRRRRRRRRHRRGNSLNMVPRHPRPLRRVQLSLLYKQRGGRELGDSVADMLYSANKKAP